MASIQFNKINPDLQITETAINFSGTMSYTTWASSGIRESGSSVTIKINDVAMDAFSITDEQVSFNTKTFKNFTPGSSAKITLQLYYNYQYQTTTTIYAFQVYIPQYYEWRTYEYDTKDEARDNYIAWLELGYSVWPTSIQDSSIIEYEGTYLIETTKTMWVTYSSNHMTEISKTFYLKPNKFYFLGDNKGSLRNVVSVKVYLDKGLQDALPNIYKFNDVATQRKRWKNQQEVTACSAFEKGKLTATMMNRAATYVGANIGDSTLGPLKLTKNMFVALEDALNK